ncbi:MAG TPA: pyridoxal-phosphate dependent enzyme [Planktothrix sp.]|jgi:cysteine synthase/cystathionine beta-lyase/cystathionine gamma-synthase
MFEPVSIDRFSLSQSTVTTLSAKLRSVAPEKQNNTVTEAVDDLAEVGFLIQCLLQQCQDEQAHVDEEQTWLHANFKQTVQALNARYRRQIDLVERTSRWSAAAQQAGILIDVRRECAAIKSALRVAYRRRGLMLCLADWQSPMYSSSVPLERNRIYEGITEHVWDYKRDAHMEALAYEKAFAREYCAHLGSDRTRAYITNSGMAAYSTVLHWLAHEQFAGEPALAVQPMYFENIHLARGFFPNLLQLQSPSADELIYQLRLQQPSIVLCDAVTNCGDVLAHEFQAVLEWAANEAEHNVAVVIDSTCLPMPLLATGLLQGLPENVTVIFVESLAKYHQFGMDTVTGGVIVAHMADACHDSFRKAKARLGTNITDGSVGSLPDPDCERLTRRMQRHSRNTRMVAEALEQFADEEQGVVESVSWLRGGAVGTPWFSGSCLTVRLAKSYRTIAIYREFEQRVVELAREVGQPVTLGTSFGFDVSRLYVTAPSTKFEDPFLRMSLGTETQAEIETLIEILKQANSDVRRAHAKELDNDLQFAPPRLAAKATTQSATASGLIEKDSAAFIGEDALERYLCPANYAPAPLVELPLDLNPFRKDGVRIMAKLMPLVPLMNIKSVPAYSMLAKAHERGELTDVSNVIESSSSNTVLSLSVMAKLFGIQSTYAIVDHSIAPGLLRMLRLFGIEVMMHPGPGHEMYASVQPRSERAAAFGRTPGWVNPGQYSNPDNPAGFAKWLAPEIWTQTQGRISVLSCGLGTCGTMVGVTQGLRERNPNIHVVANCPKSGEPVPGPRERAQLSDVTFPWQDVATTSFEMGSEESFAASIELLRRGIMGGPSSGMNYAGLLRYLEGEKQSGRLQERVSANGDLHCVFLCCDSPLPHVDEYFDALGDKYFPDVHPITEVNQTR